MIKRKKELVEYARRLKLASLAEHMTEIIHEAQEKQPTYSEFLLSCLAREAGERDRKSFLSRMKAAGLPARHTWTSMISAGQKDWTAGSFGSCGNSRG